MILTAVEDQIARDLESCLTFELSVDNLTPQRLMNTLKFVNENEDK